MNLLTTSRVKCLAQCPRKHYLAYEVGIRPSGVSRALRLGSAVHALLHIAKTGGDVDQHRLSIDWEYDLDELDRAMVYAMVHGWIWRWQNEPMDVVHSELSYQVPLCDPDTGEDIPDWCSAGQMDGVVKVGEDYMVLEHKTTGDDIGADSSYWARLRMDPQVSNYFSAAGMLGFPVTGVVYDVIRKPSTVLRQVPMLDADGCKVVLDAEGSRVLNKNGSPRQTGDTGKGWVLQSRLETVDEWEERVLSDMYSNPDKYFARRVQSRLFSELVDAVNDNLAWADMIQHCRCRGVWPRNTSACADFGGCPYLPICSSGCHPLHERPEGFIVLDDVHPELKG